MTGRFNMRAGLAAVSLLTASGLAAASEVHTVPQELWDRPRSAAAILREPAVQQAVRGYLDRPGRKLVIRHPAGQEPLLYAEELKSWLIALAVDGEHILLRADRARGEPLTLELMR
jgi:hypothetical protein